MSSPGISSRRATPQDYEVFVRLVEELRTGDPIPPKDRWEAVIAPTTLFFEAGGAVAAYAYYRVLDGTGYVTHVVVDPAHRGRGYGRVVMEELASLFRAQGCSRWCLNVKPDNTPALRLYEGVGMQRAYASTSFRLKWDKVAALPAPVRTVTGRPAEPEEEPALEAAFALPSGLLTNHRTAGKRVTVRLVDPAAPGDAGVGVASFDPQFPGAFPFRVGHATLARSLLEAMRPHALPEHDAVGLVAEDDAELTRLLRDHGAEVRMEIVHYRGEL